MNEHPFSRFIELVQFDQKIHSLENDIIKIDQEMMQLKAEQEIITSELHEAQKKVFAGKKNVDAHELEMKMLDEQEKEKKQLLDRISDYKQFQSAKTEIETIQKKQVAQEQAVLSAWNLLEAAQAESEKKHTQNAEQEKKISAALQEKQQNRSALQTELNALTAQRPEKETAVPAEWLEKYGVMRSRVTDPVVPIIQGSCGACSQVIIASDLVRAKRGALMQCKSCFRLLYLPEVMERNGA